MYVVGNSNEYFWAGTYKIPTVISGYETVRDASIGQFTMCLIDINGKIYSSGYNVYGQLGNGTNNNSYRAFTIATSQPDNVNFVRCYTTAYGICTLYLTDTNEVYSAGYNGNGMLGIGNNQNQSVLTKVLIDDVKDIAVGDSHVVYLKNDGTVWTCGSNSYGQLGLGNYNDVNIPTQIKEFSNVKSIYAGGDNTVIVDKNNDIYMCGNNSINLIGVDSFYGIKSFVKTNINIE